MHINLNVCWRQRRRGGVEQKFEGHAMTVAHSKGGNHGKDTDTDSETPSRNQARPALINLTIMKNTTINILKKYAFAITFNLNDIFYYATADANDIEYDLLCILEPLIEKYGIDVIYAYTALQRGHDPQIASHITDNYIKCKKELKELLLTKKIEDGPTFGAP